MGKKSKAKAKAKSEKIRQEAFQRTQKRRRTALGVIISLLIVAGLAWTHIRKNIGSDVPPKHAAKNEVIKAHSGPNPSGKDLRTWPTPPIPRVSPERVKPRIYVPKVPKWPVPRSIHKDPQKSRGLLNRVIAWIIESHPDNRIRDGLTNDIRNRRMTIVVQDVGPLPAAFTVLKDYEYVDFDGTMRKVDEMPAMIFHPSEVVKIMKGEDPTALWLQISHESDHYRQYQTAETAKELFYWGVKNRVYSKEECEVWWQREVKAHSFECDIAWQWGMHDKGGGQKCIRYLNGLSFNHYLFSGFHQFHGQKAPECIAAWARLAGHPNPEVFTAVELHR